MTVCPAEGKAHQGNKRELVHLERGKAQERKLRRVEEEKTVHPTKEKTQQEEWKRSLWETLRKRAEWYCGLTVPQDAELWELEWHGQRTVIMYLKCPRYSKEGCYVEDNQEQGVVPYWKKEKMSWYRCKGEKKQSGAITLYNNLGNISDIFHSNNQNHWLERRVQSPRSVP